MLFHLQTEWQVLRKIKLKLKCPHAHRNNCLMPAASTAKASRWRAMVSCHSRVGINGTSQILMLLPEEKNKTGASPEDSVSRYYLFVGYFPIIVWLFPLCFMLFPLYFIDSISIVKTPSRDIRFTF